MMKRIGIVLLCVCLFFCTSCAQKPSGTIVDETLTGSGSTVGGGVSSEPVRDPVSADDTDYFALANVDDPADHAEYGKYTFECLGEDVMPLTAWVAPPENYHSARFIHDYAESGLNTLISFAMGNTYENVDNILNLCEDEGLAMLLEDGGSTIIDANGVKQMDLLERAVKSPVFSGICGADEPGTKAFTDLGKREKIFSDLMNRKLFYVNVQGMGAGAYNYEHGNSGGPPGTRPDLTYDQHCKEYFEKCNPKVFSFDNYPFNGMYPYVEPDAFEQLSSAKNYGMMHKVPFWVYIEVAGFSTGGAITIRGATAEEIAWQVNAALAYGAKGINYFTYWSPNNSATVFTQAMVSPTGEKQSGYYAVQSENKLIAAADDVLMNSDFLGVMPAGTSPAPIPQADILEKCGNLTGVTGDHALVGCFNYRGKKAYFVLNNSLTDSDVITLNFSKKVKFEVRDGNGTTKDNSNSTTLKLKAGDGALVLMG